MAAMNQYGTTWSEERVAMLTKLWLEGWTAKDIAAELGGVTRNAVIGKVHRLELSGRQPRRSPRANLKRPQVQQANPQRPRLRRRPQEQIVKQALRIQGRGYIVVEETSQALPAPTHADIVPMRRNGKPCELLDLRHDECRWPNGAGGAEGYRFCGKAAWRVGASYCAAHARIAYRAPPRVLSRAS